MVKGAGIYSRGGPGIGHMAWTNQQLARGKEVFKKRVCYHVKSLREIRRAQKYVRLLISRLPFMRVIKKILVNLYSMMKTTSFINVEWQTQALLCLQEAAEDFAIDFMNDAYFYVAHCHRVTLMAKDYVIVSRLRYKGPPSGPS
ncbi:hypothetical protein KP509_13G062100 [Ceratopteris richardii]|uniref:Core Histone H2A/H2B/H3 domain-containing protein n=1 Tax=Ceratopteris richardii TaxID=49495 RepID=A0A8T2TJA8_CERRI|nr:hypothetical protein KP509_13G062100 [Ceratopteris richardii]